LNKAFLATLDRDVGYIRLKYNGIPRWKKHVGKCALKLVLSHAQKKCWHGVEILHSSVQTGTSSRCECGRHLESD
jgi:hypothetical protein